MLNLRHSLGQATRIACLYLAAHGTALGGPLGLVLGSGASPAEVQALALLRDLRDPDKLGPQAFATEIRTLGPSVIDSLMETLKERRVPNPDGPSQKLSKLQREAVLTAIGTFDRKALLPAWCQCFHEASEEPLARSARVAALRSLSCFGTAQDLDRVWDLVGIAAGDRGQELSELMGESLELTTASILSRDRSAFHRLESSWSWLPRSWRDELIRAVGRTGDAAGLGLFCEMMRWAPEQQRLIASQISMMGPSDDPDINAELAQILLLQLKRGSKADVQAATLALAELEDVHVAVELIELLKDERPGVPENAHRALCVLTNTNLAARYPTWRKWYQREVAWEQAERGRVLGRLNSFDPAEVQGALREISLHRLGRHELAVDVSEALYSEHEPVRLMATQVLSELGSRWGVRGLILTLSDPSEIVRDQAHAALVSVTGMDLGVAAEDWDEYECPGHAY